MPTIGLSLLQRSSFHYLRHQASYRLRLRFEVHTFYHLLYHTMPPKKRTTRSAVTKPRTTSSTKKEEFESKAKLEAKLEEDNSNSNSNSNGIKKEGVYPILPQPKNPPKYPQDPSNNNVRYWLIKSEPYPRIDPVTKKDVKFPLSEMINLEHEPWTGVRNYEARNNMINMRKGDICLFYHSNCKIPGIVGLVKVANEAHPDEEQFNARSGYYDARSTREAPKWWCVDVRFVRRFKAKVSLEELRNNEQLADMGLVKRGRLSVTDCSKEHFEEVLRMEQQREISDDIDCEIDAKYVEIQKEFR